MLAAARHRSRVVTPAEADAARRNLAKRPDRLVRAAATNDPKAVAHLDRVRTRLAGIRRGRA